MPVKGATWRQVRFLYCILVFATDLKSSADNLDCALPLCHRPLVAESPHSDGEGHRCSEGHCRINILSAPVTSTPVMVEIREHDSLQFRQTLRHVDPVKGAAGSLTHRVDQLEGSLLTLQTRLQQFRDDSGQKLKIMENKMTSILGILLAVLTGKKLPCQAEPTTCISLLKESRRLTTLDMNTDLLKLLKTIGLLGSSVEQTEKEDNTFPRDCSEIYKQGIHDNGIYTIQPNPQREPFEAFCDMVTEGGGWTVFQRRQDGAVDFNRTWQEYRQGFGMLQGEHWLGNEALHALTKDGQNVLRIELEDWHGVKRHATYRRFRIAPEAHRYRLTAREYQGDAGNALSYSKHYNHDGRQFSTADSDNDNYPSGSCAAYYGAGWWFDACLAANLNGKYHRGRYTGLTNGIYWGTWYILTDKKTNQKFSFKKVEMKTRMLHT